jgi:hypothetical protein
VAFLYTDVKRDNYFNIRNKIDDSWSISLTYIGQSIKVDSNNCIYVTLDYDIRINEPCYKIIKYSSSGIQLWSRNLESFGFFNPAIRLDSNDNIYFADDYKSQVILVKLNSSGDLQWKQSWKGVNVEYVSDIAIDSEDNLYIYGTSVSDAIFILKCDNSGREQWFLLYKGFDTRNSAWHIEVDSNSNVIISGETSNINNGYWDNEYWVRFYDSNGNLKWKSDNIILVNGDLSKPNVVKYNNIGCILWNYSIGAPISDRFFAYMPGIEKYVFKMALDSYDNIYIAGTIEIPNDYYATDLYVIKISNSGGFDWFLTWGDSKYEQLISIEIDSHDNLYLISDHHLVKNPKTNGKSLYRTTMLTLYAILFAVSGIISVGALYFILKPKYRKGIEE